MSTPRRRLLALTTAPVVLAVGVAAPAPAATITVPGGCAVDAGVQRTVPIVGTGYTPGRLVRLTYTHPTFGARLATSVVADPAGNFQLASFPAPFNSFRTREQTFGLAAQDTTNPAIVAGTTFRQVRFGASFFPNRGRPSRRVRYTVRGFQPGRNVYAHFRFGGKTRRNVKIGNPIAPCGKKSRRMRLIPARSRPGSWQVYFDQRPRFSRSTRPQVRTTIFVTRRLIRRSSVSSVVGAG